MKNFNDMNAKEEILKDLKGQLDGFQTIEKDYPKGSNSWITIQNEISKLQSLITAVENAIFDVPSEEEMLETLTEEKARKNNFIDLNAYAIGICEARNYILNYKKPETDGK